MRKKRPWHSFEGLPEGQKKTKARTGLVLAVILFVLVNLIAFL